LFVANSLRWLAATPAWYPVVAAGLPLTAASAGEAARVIDASGRAIDPLGVPFVPPSAVDLRLTTAGRTLSVSLLDPDVTLGRGDNAMAMAALDPLDAGSGAGAATWLGVLALALLAFEWYLFQRGRLP